MTTTFERLRDLVAKDYKVPIVDITPEATLETLGIDSLGVAELLFTIEDEFAIDLPADAVPLATVGDVARYIDELIAAQASPPPPGAPPESAPPAA